MSSRKAKLVEKLVSKFEKEGPYTSAEVFRLAKIIIQQDDWQIGDSLGEVIHKFSPTDLKLLMDRYIEDEDLRYACGEQLDLSSKIAFLSYEHLEIVASYDWTSSNRKIASKLRDETEWIFAFRETRLEYLQLAKKASMLADKRFEQQTQ